MCARIKCQPAKMLELILKAVLLLFGTLSLAFCFLFGYAPFQVFKRMGVKGPKPALFTGNVREFRKSGQLSTMMKWTHEYGKVFGYFQGPSARLMVLDLDMLKQIMVKDFDNFVDRATGLESFTTILQKGYPPELIAMRGEQWRQTRRIIRPVFSTRQLKLNMPLIKNSCAALLDKMEEVAKSGDSVDFWKIFGQYSMEVVISTAFGHKVSILRGTDDEVIDAAMTFFEAYKTSTGIVLLTALLSKIPLLYYLMKIVVRRTAAAKAYSFLLDAAMAMVQTRRQMKGTSENKDLLQLMIDARADDEENENPSAKKFLTDKEIVSLSVGFLLAGYDTTGNMLGYVAYLLALNPGKQDLLIQEIDSFVAENEDCDEYEACQKIEYLEWVVMEALRIYPAVPRTVRECKKTTTVGGITIPKGMKIAVFLHTLHHLPELWDEPEAFWPERHCPEQKEGRHPMSFMPFGFGPRQCIGMRLAILEAKMALISILRKYKFVRSPETEVPLKTLVGITLSPANGIFLRVEPRQ